MHICHKDNVVFYSFRLVQVHTNNSFNHHNNTKITQKPLLRGMKIMNSFETFKTRPAVKTAAASGD